MLYSRSGIRLACRCGGLTLRLTAGGLLLPSHTFRRRSTISLTILLLLIRPHIVATIAVAEFHKTEQLLIRHQIIILRIASSGLTISFLILRNLLDNVILDRFLIFTSLLLVCSYWNCLLLLLAMRIDVEIDHITLKLLWLFIIVRISPFLLCGDRGWFTGLADLLYKIVCLGLSLDFLARILGIGVRSSHGWGLTVKDTLFVIIGCPHW